MGKYVIGCLSAVGLVIVVIVASVGLSRLGIWEPRRAIATTFLTIWDGVTGCGDKVAMQAPSPDDKYIATVIVTECYEDVITVEVDQPAGGLSHMLFGARLRDTVSNTVALRWPNDTTLIVEYKGNPDLVYSSDGDEWQGVRFAFRGVPNHLP